MLYGIKDCANLTLFDKATGEPVLYSDYANVSTNEWSADRIYATAKGTNAIAWDNNKKSTLQVETEVFDLKWLAIVAGSDFSDPTEAQIAKREVVRVDETKQATLSGTPVEGSVAVIKLASDEIVHIGKPLQLATSPDGGQTPPTPVGDQFALNGSTITFSDDAVVGDVYAVYYFEVNPNTRVLEIKADKFPKAFEIQADVLIREKETGVDQFVQITYPIARPQSNFTITMDVQNPTNLQVTFDLFPDKDNNIAVYKIIGD